MRELALESLHADGEHLVLVDSEGTRFRLPIDEALRIAVRRDRPQLEALRAREASALRPRDIQSRLREGSSVDEVAAEGGISLDAVRRYEGPVRAEQAWIVQQTRGLQIGREVGSPTLGDLVVDRLATRGARTAVTWRALRRVGEPWTVTVEFEADGQQRRAAWHVDLHARSLAALDEESRWLSETDLGQGGRPFDVEADESPRGADVTMAGSSAPAARTTGAKATAGTSKKVRSPQARHPRPTTPATRGAAAGESAVDEAPAVEQTLEQEAATDVLLERLAAARGKRAEQTAAPTAPDAGTEAAESAGMNAPFDDALFPVAPVLHLRPTDQPDGEAQAEGEAPTEHTGADPSDPAEQGPGAESDADEAQAPKSPSRSKRNRRTSVPSWDEIVFGSRSD